MKRLGISIFGIVFAAAFFRADAAQIAGLIQPFREATLSASVIGRISKVNFKEGDVVPADAIILELDKRAEEIEAERRKIIWEVRAELDAATMRVETLKHDLESSKKLQEATKSVSKDELAKKALDLRVAEAEFEQLTRREDIEKLEYEFAIEQVHRREIRAPHSGQIVEILPKTGEVCEPRQPLVRFVDASQCYFVGNLDAAEALKLKRNEHFTIQVANGKDSISVDSVIEFISPVIDAASGLRRVKLLIDNREGRVVPGSPATLVIEAAK